MDNHQKSCCPNCSQVYYLKSFSDPKAKNIPLFLPCGHTMCENCITNIVKFEEPIECKICHRDMQLSKEEICQLNLKKIKLYTLFPVNLHVLGELTLQLIEKQPGAKDNKENKNYFVDLHSIFNSVDATKGKCMECHNLTSKMCQQCATVLCDTCFNKSHKNFVIFKNHVLVNIEPVTTPNTCKLHKGKPLDYYCHDCKKSACMDCLMVGGDKSCKNHNVVPIQEVNDDFMEDLLDIVPKVDEVFRRLTQTAVDIGLLLYKGEHENASSELTNVLTSVKQNFSKIMAALQKQEKVVTDSILKLQSAETDSLFKSQQEVASAIKKGKVILNAITLAVDPKKSKQVNLAAILEDARDMVETPWYLHKDESENALKVTVNEDLCTLVSDYVHLEGNASSVYKLRSSSELTAAAVELPPAPPAPVFPPELPKDVRQTSKAGSEKLPSPRFCRRVPGYRCKSGSVSSLNSLHSDSSDRGYSYGDGFQGYQRPNVQPVQPFAESQHPKQLHEGSQELIYICHIVDPHNFFVQRACHQGLVKEMLREFRNAANLPKPSLSHVAEGKVYLMFNKADNMWQRCRIVSIIRKDPANPTFAVFCVDFGSTETVSIDKLRLLPPARVQTPYPLAINCCLANCEPVTGSWTCEDAYLIQNIIDNKQAILHVRQIRSTSNYSMTLECDITTFEDGVSLAHALVFHERAKMPNPRLRYPKQTSANEKPKIFMNNDLEPKSTEEVYITHVVNPDKFYVRKTHLMKVFEKLCEDLDHEYGQNQNASNVYLPEIGVAYAVNIKKCREHIEDLKWARCVILELPGRGRVRALLPDIGHTVIVHWSALRQLQPHFTMSRALASECQLAGVTPLNKKWSEKSVALLQQLSGRVLSLVVEEARGGSPPAVTLYDHADTEPVCVNALMIRHKFAVSFGIFMFNKDFDVADQVYTNKSPLDPPQSTSRPPGQVKILKKNDKGKPKKINEKELDAKDKGPLRLEAKVLHYQSPSLLYISLVHQQKAFSELFDEIQKHYSKKTTEGKDTWVVGDRCCTLCSKSETWRRAVILELEGNNAKVFYADFACIETVPIASLRELKPEFMSVGDAAIKCHLCGIVPADGNEEWPTITKEYLKELLDAYHRVFITKLGNFKNNSMPVEMWVFHMIQGGALEPNKSEWRCLNKKIIEQGLAIPDKALKVNNAEDNSNKDDMLSFLKNVTGSVEDWLQLEPLPTKPLSTVTQPEIVDESSEEEEDRPSEATNASNTMFITDWLPPEPLPSTEFTGMPTYIDNDGLVYLHDVTQQATLEMIRNALDVRFKGPDPKAKYAKWTVGEPCIAMFYLDNKFYRGRVIHVDQEAANCIIHYIDYGNEEICSFENLRKSIVLHQIPTQAHKCVLDKIRPIGTHWDRQTLDYIHKSVVEKNCYVKVTGNPVGDIIPITLKYDKFWINDHLVDLEMAVYADGAKAVVRKFAGGKKNKHEPKPVQIEHIPSTINTSSEPDFIVEEEEAYSSAATSFSKSTDILDWNKAIDEDETNKEIQGKFIAYPSNNLQEFICNVHLIRELQTIELTIIHNDETNILYEEMFKEIQEEGSNRPPLDGIFENKACIALFHEDNLWYRAAILEFSESKSCVKVRYVDYGNVEVVSLADVREIDKEWTTLPPRTVTARLSNIQVNQDKKMSDIAEEYANTFLEKGPFNAKLINFVDAIPNVELRDDSDELVYENMIQSGIFLRICDE